MLQLVTASRARPRLLAIGAHEPFVACRRPPCVAGNRACRRPFRPPSNRPLTPVRRHFSGFVFRRHSAAKPEKFVAYRKRRPERPPARSKASPWLESRMWGKMASCCRLVIGLYESSSPFMGLKGRLHGRKPRPSGSPGLRRGRQFAHQRNCRRVVPRRGFHPLSWAEGPCGQARLPATRRSQISACQLMAIPSLPDSLSLQRLKLLRGALVVGCKFSQEFGHGLRGRVIWAVDQGEKSL
jgi:hypothetical protein